MKILSQVEKETSAVRLFFPLYFNTAQNTVGFPGCKCTLLVLVQLLIYQDPQVLLHRAALKEIIPQFVLVPGIAPTQVQHPALGLIEPH